jgi:hypothetical protein
VDASRVVAGQRGLDECRHPVREHPDEPTMELLIEPHEHEAHARDTARGQRSPSSRSGTSAVSSRANSPPTVQGVQELLAYVEGLFCAPRRHSGGA